MPVPYRDSKLTRILADSLASRTLLIATITPKLSQCEETASVL